MARRILKSAPKSSGHNSKLGQLVESRASAAAMPSDTELTPQKRALDYWTREFDVLHTRMHGSKARQAVDALFSATDIELNNRDA